MNRIAGTVGLALLLNGCLSGNYQIGRAELQRMARLPPAERGERVRVVQQLTSNEDDVTPDEPPPPPATTLVVVNGAYGTGCYDCESEPHGHRGHEEHEEHEQSEEHGHGAADAVAAGLAAVVVAGGVAVGAAAIEGQRFDGWARLNKDEPLLLVWPGGRQWVPLSSLNQQNLLWADHAVVHESDAELERLERAPLNRRGFAYELELGTARLNTRFGARDFGFASRLGLGYFPTRDFGVLFGGQFAYGHAHAPDAGEGTVFNGRLFAELQYLPISSGRFHAGFYTELGGSEAKQDFATDTSDWSGLYAAGGALMQLEVSTRLAVNLRGGLAGLPTYGGGALDLTLVPELSLGLAVY